jgi:hypothetical protein
MIFSYEIIHNNYKYFYYNNLITLKGFFMSSSVAAYSPSVYLSLSFSSGSNELFPSSKASIASSLSLSVFSSLSSFPAHSSVATIAMSQKLSALESINKDCFKKISSFLNLQDIDNMSLVSRSIMKTSALDFIQKARKEFKEILALDLFDQNRLDDSRYLFLYKHDILQKIKEVPELLEIFRNNNENCEKTAQEIKDIGWLKACIQRYFQHL